jgi:ABC-type microcin C transport system permease subunit YejB
MFTVDDLSQLAYGSAVVEEDFVVLFGKNFVSAIKGHVGM